MQLLADKTYDPAGLQASLGMNDAGYAEILTSLLEADNKLVKNRAAKLLARFSEAAPVAVYPHRKSLERALASGQSILQWNAMASLGHLARVAEDSWIKGILPLLFRFLRDDSMITAGHAITSLGRIAAVREGERETIVASLIEADAVPRDPECTAILAGKILTALMLLCAELGPSGKAALRVFGEKHSRSHRGSNRREADKLLRRLAGAGLPA